MATLYKLRWLLLVFGLITLCAGLGLKLMFWEKAGYATIKYGLILVVVGIIFLQAMRQLKSEQLQKTQAHNHELEEIEITGFNGENPVIKIQANGTAWLIFEFFPPENENLARLTAGDFEQKLSEYLGIKVLRDDRELFIIPATDKDTIHKLLCYFKQY